MVLIVEDEMLEQEFIKSIVREELFPQDTLLTCESGIEAVNLAEQYRPNIIITDVLIPELDGLSAIEKIRKFLLDVSVAVLSAYSDFAYAQKAIRLQVFEYLLKPVKSDTIKQVFRKMMDSTYKYHSMIGEKIEQNTIDSTKCNEYFIEKSVEYIKQHFREKITLEMIASRVFLNPD